MSYEIRYSDLVSVRTQIVAYSNTIRTQLADLQQTYSALMTSGCMTGETAETLNTYIAYVHEVILSMIDSMLQEYVDKLLAYENGLREIEGNRNAILFEAEMERLSDALSRAKKKYGGITGDVSTTLGSVSDIYSHSAPSITGVNDGYDKTKKIADQLKKDIGSYEHKHRKDCSEVQKYITQINRLLVKHQNYESSTINIDYIKGLVTGDEVQELLKLQESTNKFSESNQVAIEKGYELMKTEMEEAAAKQREIDGAFKILTGVVVVSSIVLTGGAAAPAVLLLEAGAVAYGAAEITEGVQDVYYGAKGDSTTAAINSLRDTIFFGNQTAYEVFGLVTTVGSAGGAQLAKQGVKITSKNLFKAAAKEGAKNLASDFVGYGAGEVAGHFGASDGQRQFVSIVAGLGTSYGLDKADALIGKNKGGSKFKYEHNPSDNPKVLVDAIEDPSAVYGYSPNPDSESIGGYANNNNPNPKERIDWSDPTKVSDYRARRELYHQKNDNISEIVMKMKSEGASSEEIARAANNQRNANRLNDYISNNDYEGLERVKKRNLAKYKNENGPTAESLFEKYGSWEKVIEKSMSANPGMDACCGLYDKYYHLYGLD